MGKIKIYTDGGARGNPGPAAIGGAVFLDDQLVHQFAQTVGVATNNEAEYAAFLSSLDWLLTSDFLQQAQEVIWYLDSKLVVEQINRRWKIKKEHLAPFVSKAWTNLAKLSCNFEIKHIAREQNSLADSLVNQALDA